MIAVIQRCSRGKVTVAKKVISEIKHGMVILLGVDKMDTDTDANYLVNKISELRIFNDEKNIAPGSNLVDFEKVVTSDSNSP